MSSLSVIASQDVS